MQLSTEQKHLFQERVRSEGDRLYRPMPWRETPSAYYVVVSELMLQQTQVARVMTKFTAFIERFATFEVLARAAQSEVIEMWAGLGYNRRARFLHQIAQHIVQHGIPTTQRGWQDLPGIGCNTAGAIMAYVYNEPVVYVETNIRTVIIHEYYPDEIDVDEQQIYDIVQQTVDVDHPREWYWAMMDYGADLKARGFRYNARMKQYKKQSALKGSVREVRGQIVDVLRKESSIERSQLEERFDGRLSAALDGLMRDGIVSESNQIFSLTK